MQLIFSLIIVSWGASERNQLLRLTRDTATGYGGDTSSSKTTTTSSPTTTLAATTTTVSTSAETETANSTDTSTGTANSTDASTGTANSTDASTGTANSTVAIPVHIVTESKLHSSLVFPIAQLLPVRHLNDTQFIQQYCEPLDAFAALPSVGTGAARYTAAVAAKLPTGRTANSVTSSLMQTRSHVGAGLFLNVDRHSVSSTRSSFIDLPVALYGSCTSDSDCVTGRRSHCLDGMCRECSGPTVQSDCPNVVNADFCSAETQYTCSECLSDSDCGGMGYCNFAFPSIDSIPMMPRKVCTLCANVPADAELFDVARCAWRCPVGSSPNGSGCSATPVCTDRQYLGPSGQTDDLWYTKGVNASTPVCAECSRIGPIDNSTFCAVLVNDTLPGIVGNLNPPSPCGTFTCKQGYRLNSGHDTCLKCRYGSCPPGQWLDGCIGDSAGVCAPCDPSGLTQTDVNATWVDLQRSGLVAIVTDPSAACLRICLDGFFRNTTNACVSCDVAEAQNCRIGQIISDCGPGTDSGTCVNCPPIPDGQYWTGTKCEQALCANRACPPGTMLTGCGGESPGVCAPCPGGLPTGAVVWTTGCNFRCAQNEFVANSKCNVCDPAVVCKAGQKIVGCGLDGITTGTCSDCPSLGIGVYYSLGKECTPSKCDPTMCVETSTLTGCGYGDQGSCVSCGRPQNGLVGFTRRANLDCQPVCSENAFALSITGPVPGTRLPLAATVNIGPVGNNPPTIATLPAYDGKVFTCKSCTDPGVCLPGYYVTKCGGSDSKPGICVECSPDTLQNDQYWTGGPNCQTANCSDISCKNDQVLTTCGKMSSNGGYGPGTCTPCSQMATLPPNAVSWTNDPSNQRTCVPVCAPGYIEDKIRCRLCTAYDNCGQTNFTGTHSA